MPFYVSYGVKLLIAITVAGVAIASDGRLNVSIWWQY
jgi:hypothetical protein